MDYGNQISGVNANYNQSAKVAHPNISDAVNDLAPVVKRIEEYIGRLSQCNDQLTGPRPQGVEKTESSPEPSHLLYAVQRHRGRLGLAADVLEKEIERLENSLSSRS